MNEPPTIVQSRVNERGLRYSLGIQRRVLKAMVFRELKTRFGARRLGYLWIVLEPITHISVFIVLFELGRRKSLPDMPFPLMLLTGLIPFFAFRTTLTACMEAANSNQGLFSYTRVKPYDAILARAILEGIVAVLSFFTLYFLFSFYMGFSVKIENIPKCFAAAGLLWMLSLGAGTVFCVLVRIFPELRKFVPLLVRPLYFVSGVFFLAADLNLQSQVALSYNPVFVLIENLRDGFFPAYESPISNWVYPLYFAVTLNSLGLILYRRYRNRLIGKQQ